MSIRKYSLAIIVALIPFFAPGKSALAQVSVVRGGAENPMVTIGKSTLYGSGTGLLLGLALTLIINNDSDDVFRWSFAAGTLSGFTLGIMHVTTRPKPRAAALLQFNSRGLARVAVPKPQLMLNQGRKLKFEVNLISLSL